MLLKWYLILALFYFVFCSLYVLYKEEYLSVVIAVSLLWVFFTLWLIAIGLCSFWYKYFKPNFVISQIYCLAHFRMNYHYKDSLYHYFKWKLKRKYGEDYKIAVLYRCVGVYKK